MNVIYFEKKIPKRIFLIRLMFSLFLISLTVGFTGCRLTPERAKVKAFKLYDDNRYKEAMTYFEQAFTGELTDPEFLVRYSYCLIECEFDPKYSVEMLYENTRRFPDYARSYYMLGHVASRFSSSDQGANISQALRFMRRAAELDTLSVAVMTDMARYHILLNNLDSAQFWCEKALKLEPDNPSLQANLKDLRELIASDSLLSGSSSLPTP